MRHSTLRHVFARLKRLPFGRQLCKLAFTLLCRDKACGVLPESEARAILEKYSPDPQGSGLTERDLPEPRHCLLVVIPVYNCESYVGECIESVLSQETDFDFIVRIVNDGSTDASRKIVARYASDPRIEIIDRPNGGQARARNAALANLDAAYVTFVDADDLLAPGAFQKMMDVIRKEDCDIVQGAVTRFKGDKTLYHIHTPDASEIATADFCGLPFAKIFKAGLFRNIQFPTGYWYEDLVTDLLIYPSARKVSSISDTVYRYRHTPGSITSEETHFPKAVDSLYVTLQLVNDARQAGLLNKHMEMTADIAVGKASTTFLRTIDAPGHIKQAVFSMWHHLYHEILTDWQADTPELRRLQEAVMAGDYRRYLFECLVVNY